MKWGKYCTESDGDDCTHGPNTYASFYVTALKKINNNNNK